MTDLAPGIEFDRVVTEVEDAPIERAVSGDERFVPAARRIAEVELPAPREVRFRVDLMLAGQVVAQRSGLVVVNEPRAVTVTIPRSCGGVLCEAGLTCIAGSCCNDRCVEGTEPECCALQCTAASDCDGLPTSLPNAEWQCQQGACLAVPAEGSLRVRDVDIGGIEPEATLCFVTYDGAVWCGGDNALLQAGSTDASAPRPLAPVEGVTGAVSVTANGGLTCAVAGVPPAAYCWGSNLYRQLGRLTGSTGPSAMPGEAGTNLPGVARVLSCGFWGCARSPTGAMTCWGRNTAGVLGMSPALLREGAPYPLSGVEEMACTTEVVCVLTTAREVSCTGAANARGDGAADVLGATPSITQLPWPARALTATGESFCATSEAGDARCWGSSPTPELDLPLAVPALDGLAVVEASAVVSPDGTGSRGCALDTDGAVWCWGPNDEGQLGQGNTAPIAGRVRVTTRRFHALDTATRLTCAIEQGTDSLWCWGASDFAGGPTPRRVYPP